MKISAGTIARTIVLLIALINQALVINGKQVLPIADDDVYQIVSFIFTIVASLVAWWKNNSFSTNAILADKYLKKMNSEEENKGGGSDENIH